MALRPPRFDFIGNGRTLESGELDVGALVGFPVSIAICRRTCRARSASAWLAVVRVSGAGSKGLARVAGRFTVSLRPLVMGARFPYSARTQLVFELHDRIGLRIALARLSSHLQLWREGIACDGWLCGGRIHSRAPYSATVLIASARVTARAAPRAGSAPDLTRNPNAQSNSTTAVVRLAPAILCHHRNPSGVAICATFIAHAATSRKSSSVAALVAAICASRMNLSSMRSVDDGSRKILRQCKFGRSNFSARRWQGLWC